MACRSFRCWPRVTLSLSPLALTAGPHADRLMMLYSLAFYSCWKARISSRATRNVKVFTSLVLFYASIISHNSGAPMFYEDAAIGCPVFLGMSVLRWFFLCPRSLEYTCLTEKQPIERDDCRLTAVKFSVHLRIAQSFCCAFPHTTDESQ